MTPLALLAYIICAGIGLFIVGILGLLFLMMLGAIKVAGIKNDSKSAQPRRRRP